MDSLTEGQKATVREAILATLKWLIWQLFIMHMLLLLVLVPVFEYNWSTV